MLFKLSLKNIKKSIKDYSIYFFTLVFAVAMFYMFNSIDAQKSMLELNEAKSELIGALVRIIEYISVFVSIVLGFLIVYSNNFLIRKRKKEIGLYQTLGMSKRKVSMILVIETLIIGVISLVVGLILGILSSQFVSFLTAKLFEVNMSEFKFVFSYNALTKTLMYFGIIFLFVMIFNVLTLSKYKLIDLINASRKNEKVKFRNKYVTIISFILSFVLLIYAYYLLFNDALIVFDNNTTKMIISGALGTFLLFFSLSGFLVKTISLKKNIYYKNLNMFTLKQINSKLTSTVISTTIISLMLLLTIGILSGSMSLASVFNTDIKENNLTDYTINVFGNFYDEIDNEDYNKKLENIKNEISSSKFKKYSKEEVLYNLYASDELRLEDLVLKEDLENLKVEYGNAISIDYEMPIMKFSDYKNIMNLYGNPVKDINNQEYLMLANMDIVKKVLKSFQDSNTGINFNGKHLTPKGDIIDIAIENYNSSGNTGVIVVKDELLDGLNLKTLYTHIIGNYVDTDDLESLEKNFREYVLIDFHKNTNASLNFRTKIDMEASSVGLKAMFTFIGLYLGITFAITSATILAIGELSRASDNKVRYKILKELGASERMLNNSLLTQILVIFLFPLLIALIHSYFGLREINNIAVLFTHINLTSNILLTTLFMILVYGGYLLITYRCSKNLIK